MSPATRCGFMNGADCCPHHNEPLEASASIPPTWSSGFGSLNGLRWSDSRFTRLRRSWRIGGTAVCGVGRQVRDLLRLKVADINAKLSELEAFRTTLSQFLDECERTIAGASKDSGQAAAHCPVIDTLTRER